MYMTCVDSYSFICASMRVLLLRVFMHACACVWLCMFERVGECMYICVCMRARVCAYVCSSVWVSACIRVCLYACACVMHAFIRAVLA